MKANGAEAGLEHASLDIPDCVVTDDQFRLFYAAYEGDLQLTQSLNVLGWSINSYDYDGRTALAIAASEGNLAIVKYLVAHGAAITHRDIRNNDALADARRENRHECVAFLEEALVQ